MALAIKDRVKELTTTTGTGTLTLVSAPSGFRRFNSVLSDGDTTYYCIESGSQWEVGLGTYTANTLARTTVLASSNSNARINITSSRSYVFITYAADKSVYRDNSNRAVVGSAGLIFSDNTVQTTAATTPDLSPYAPLASPAFTGVPTAPTASGGTNTTQIATTAFVASSVGSIDLSPYLTISSAASTYLTQSSATTLLAAKADLVGGLVPSSQLPSYVDDVVEAANLAAFPGTGETGKIYVAIDTGYTYRWSGSVYVRINEVDLSSYLTAATAASTYLPLAGGTLTGDLKFTDALYDIGKSGATRPRDGFFSRDLVVGGQLKPKNGDQWSPSIQNSAFGTGTGINFTAAGTFFIDNNSPVIQVGIGGQSKLVLGCELRFASTIGAAEDLVLVRDAADTFAQRRTTNPQTYRLYETFSSSTSFGSFQIKANTGAAYQIGSVIGSAGGSNRAIAFGHWDATGTFASALSVNTDGSSTFGTGVTIRNNIDVGTGWALRFNGTNSGIEDGQASGTGLRLLGNVVSVFSNYIRGAWGHIDFTVGNVDQTFLSLGQTSSSTTTSSRAVFRAAQGLHVRHTTLTSPASFSLTETYTSTTSFGAFQIQANTGGAYQIGSAVGSAGGSNRDLGFGHWNAAGTFTSRIYITAAGNVGISHGSVSYLRDVFQVNTTSTSTSFGSASIATQGITITNSTNTINRPVGLQFSGYEGWGFGGVYGTMTDNGGNTSGRISIALRPPSGGSYTEICRWSETTGAFSVFPWASTSGSPTIFTVTGPAHTTLAASTEATDVNFNLARTVQFSTGALTTQRAFRIQAPTYSFVGASTITTASTLSISGAPVAGTNATITNAYALHIESGNALFTGQAIFNGTGSGLGLAQLQGANWWIYSGGTFQSPLFNCNGWYGMVDGANGGMQFFSEHGIVWSGSGTSGTITRNSLTGDVGLYRDASGVLAQRFGTTAQTLRVYNTYTSTTSSESGELRWTSNVLYIGSNKGSAGGSARNVAITHGGNVVANFLADRFYLGPIADSTATGGNARGANSVDLQTVRTTAAQVASGLRSVVIGSYNTASAIDSVAIGSFNTASSTSNSTGSIAIGGSCTASSWYSIAVGYSCSSSGFASSSLGDSCSATGDRGSFAAGRSALAYRTSMFAFASSSFSTAGDAQKFTLVGKIKTTNSSPTSITWGIFDPRFTIPSGKTISCKITVKGIRSDGSAKARFVRLVEITNVGGTTALDTPVEAIGTDYNPSGCACDITADNTNDALDISVTGVAAETWRWVCIVEGLEIAYGT